MILRDLLVASQPQVEDTLQELKARFPDGQKLTITKQINRVQLNRTGRFG